MVKNMLVTGGAGFIGSNLVDLLIEDGHKVTVWDNLITGLKDNVNPAAEFCLLDIRDIEPEEHKNRFDVIFHLAGLARIQPSFDNPAFTHESNVSGTINILEIARKSNVPCTKVVYAGSSAFYHDVHANPYTCTKWIAEEYCKLYSKCFEVPTAIARFFNVYGPRQIETGAYATVVGIFERQKREKEKCLTITNSPKGWGVQRRDFTHVNDITSGLVAMSKEYWKGEVFNLGTGENHSIMEVAKMFKPPSYGFLETRPGEAQDTLADISFTTEKLGWKPEHRLEDYVEKFVSDLK